MVVIVDDEEAHANLISEGLLRLGYTTRVFTGPRAGGLALLAAQEGALDGAMALVVDLNLDQVHGFFNGGELLRALRHLRIAAPICLLSGVFVDAATRAALRARFDAVLEKPVRLAPLVRFLHEHAVFPGTGAEVPLGHRSEEDSGVRALAVVH